MTDLMKIAEQEWSLKRKQIIEFKAGDTINVHVKIKEGTKERVQQFQGLVLYRRNKNRNGESFCVRKVSNSVGVERTFPLLSPNIEKIELIRQGKVRRAKLYYMRERKGKATRIKEKLQARQVPAAP